MIERKKILLAPLRFIDSILDRICAAAGALAFAQFPQYLVLYLQRLGGHADEAARGLEKYREIAREAGQTLNQYVQHLMASKDAVVFKTGQKIALDLERSARLAEALKELTDASAYKKFFVFIMHADGEIALKTWVNFTPGLPLTLEAAAYAAAGVVAGMAVYLAVSRLVVLAVKKIAAPRKKDAPAAPAVP